MADTLPLVMDETIYQGATWRRHYRWLPGGVPVQFVTEGWLARLQVRANYADSASEISLSLTSDVDGGITLDDDGNILWVATDEQTTLLTRSNAKRYDLELEAPNNGDVTRFLMGAVILSGEVTRDPPPPVPPPVVDPS